MAYGRGHLGRAFDDGGSDGYVDADVGGAWMPVPDSSLYRLIAQLRSAAAAALMLPTSGTGSMEPAPVV